jgi:hypothetical protein
VKKYFIFRRYQMPEVKNPIRRVDPTDFEKIVQKRNVPKGVDRPLTAKQRRFVGELVSNDGMITMREAAIRAGYAPRSAHSRAWELTNVDISPHVVAEIRRQQSELDAKYGVTYERHVRDLKDIRDDALQNGAYSAAVQAEKARGQAQGDIYVSRSEVRYGSIDSMSKEEVLAELKKLEESYTDGLIDVTPEEDEGPPDDDAESGVHADRGRVLEEDEVGDSEEQSRLDNDEAGELGASGSS